MPPKKNTSDLTDSQKLDLLVQSIAEVKERQEHLELLVTRVATLEAKVGTQERVIQDLQREVKELKFRDNYREQLSRGCAHLQFPGLRLGDWPFWSSLREAAQVHPDGSLLQGRHPLSPFGRLHHL